MLNDAQRNRLRIAMRLIEEKLRDIEQRLAQPEQRGLLSDMRNDVTPEMERSLREKIQMVDAVIEDMRKQFALPAETKLASREILEGLPQLWVMLQETNAKSLGRYGSVDPALAPLLDPRIETLARLMFEMEDAALRAIQRV
jgi:hypothetical protein